MSEEALLIAVRDRIREFCNYGIDECDVQPDEYAPNNVGECYVAVMPGEISAGPRHESSGGVIDEIYSVNVLVIARAASVPLDRRSGQFLTNVSGMAERCRKIRAAIDFSYEVTTAADGLMVDVTKRFCAPLKWRNTSRQDHADAEIFNTAVYKGKQAGGVKRTLNFGGARLVTVRT